VNTGGTSPITGATVIAYQAGTTPGAHATQLATATTDSRGGFNARLDPAPADGAIVYFVVSGGNGGSGTNSAISEIAVWGWYCKGHPGCNLPSSVAVDERFPGDGSAAEARPMRPLHVRPRWQWTPAAGSFMQGQG